MALIGYEIIQSRTWIDPNAEPAPLLNHKNVFPITVFDAVRENMYDNNSKTLQQALEEIDKEIDAKQPIIPAMSANNIMTYGGYEGGIGSIKIAESISNDKELLSSAKIPTEKAVGEYVNKLIDHAIQNDVKVTWNELIGKPTLYNELGSDDFGFVSQKAITNIIQPIQITVDKINKDYIGYSSPIIKQRPPNTASDENGNGNLIPDVQWVLDKVIELITEHEELFMEKLKDILPCFTTPPPAPIVDTTIEFMEAADIEGLVDGTITGTESDSLNISGYLMSRIPDAIVTKLVNGETEPEESDRIVVEDIWIEGIDDATVLGIMDGTIIPEESEDLIIPAELIEKEGCGCPCCTGELYEGDDSVEEPGDNTESEDETINTATAMTDDMISQLVESVSNSI